MQNGYSIGALARHALNGHADWPQAWTSPEPKSSYDVVIVGAGGHGLATAFYLAHAYGITDVAVIDKGWLGGGNTGRNTTIVRSNYLFPESAAFYDFALRLYEGLSATLNFNIMLSQRGLITLAHSRHDLDSITAWVNAMQLNGIDAAMLSKDEIARRAPALDLSPTARLPIMGGFLQPRAGIARHDAVAWGYARAAAARGVQIIQNCPVTGFLRDGGRITGVDTAKGPIRAKKTALAAAGHTSVLAEMAGFRLPLVSYALQAMVSEPIKPVLDTVLLSLGTGVYVSHSDKGELVLGGALDLYPSYAQRGNLPTVEKVFQGLLAMMPSLSRVKWMRQWAGITDVVHDSSPIIDKAPVDGLYLNCGWGTGGFKAIPAGGHTLAHLIARDERHPLATAFGLDRFDTGALIDEAAAAGIAH